VFADLLFLCASTEACRLRSTALKKEQKPFDSWFLAALEIYVRFQDSKYYNPRKMAIVSRSLGYIVVSETLKKILTNPAPAKL
jgi:hypothetical protein